MKIVQPFLKPRGPFAHSLEPVMEPYAESGDASDHSRAVSLVIFSPFHLAVPNGLFHSRFLKENFSNTPYATYSSFSG